MKWAVLTNKNSGNPQSLFPNAISGNVILCIQPRFIAFFSHPSNQSVLFMGVILVNYQARLDDILRIHNATLLTFSWLSATTEENSVAANGQCASYL